MNILRCLSSVTSHALAYVCLQSHCSLGNCSLTHSLTHIDTHTTHTHTHSDIHPPHTHTHTTHTRTHTHLKSKNYLFKWQRKEGLTVSEFCNNLFVKLDPVEGIWRHVGAVQILCGIMQLHKLALRHVRAQDLLVEILWRTRRDTIGYHVQLK